jgi:hypothetical protein
MSNVLTWTDARDAGVMISERLRRVRESHHAMWNYVTYRDAIALLGIDPADVYPGGTTRLDPARWADRASADPPAPQSRRCGQPSAPNL